MVRVIEVYPDRFGNVRNVEVIIKPVQDGSEKYAPSLGQRIRRHVSNLVIFVPAEDQGTGDDRGCVRVNVGEHTQDEDEASDFLRGSGGTVSLPVQGSMVRP